jgi:hypothetical protein
MWTAYQEITTQGLAEWHRQATEDRQLFLLRTSRKPAVHRRLRERLGFRHHSEKPLAPVSAQR